MSANKYKYIKLTYKFVVLKRHEKHGYWKKCSWGLKQYFLSFIFDINGNYKLNYNKTFK